MLYIYISLRKDVIWGTNGSYSQDTVELMIFKKRCRVSKLQGVGEETSIAGWKMDLE